MNKIRIKNILTGILAVSILLLVPLIAIATTAEGVSLTVTDLTSALLLVAVVIGVLLNLWKITTRYGGVIGSGLRLIGTGIVFLSIEAVDRAALSFGTEGIVGGIFSGALASVVHDSFLILALFFITLGFIKFYSATKS